MLQDDCQGVGEEEAVFTSGFLQLGDEPAVGVDDIVEKAEGEIWLRSRLVFQVFMELIMLVSMPGKK